MGSCAGEKHWLCEVVVKFECVGLIYFEPKGRWERNEDEFG